MAIIGNPIYQSAFVTDQFSGDGTTTAFTMSVAPAGVSNVLVVVSGVVQDPSTYGVVGTTLNFTSAPPSGTGNISCRYLGVPVTGVTTTAYRTVTEFTATASQTTFTPPSYTVGFINVYRNGVLLGSADYTATNGTTVVLAVGATAGDLVTVESFQVSSVVNAIQNTAGSVSANNLATDSVTTDKIEDGAVTQAKLAAGAGSQWTTTGSDIYYNTGNVGIGLTPFANSLTKGLDLINGTGLFGFNNSSYYTSNAYFDGGWKYKASTGATGIFSEYIGEISFYNAASGTAGGTLTWTEVGRFDASGNLKFNSGYGSSATAYGCRAWVKFDGDPISIAGSGNVSSITDNGTGNYTVNFTNAMPDTTYVGLICDEMPSATNWGNFGTGTRSTTSCRVYSNYGGTLYDAYGLQVAFVR